MNFYGTWIGTVWSVLPICQRIAGVGGGGISCYRLVTPFNFFWQWFWHFQHLLRIYLLLMKICACYLSVCQNNNGADEMSKGIKDASVKLFHLWYVFKNWMSYALTNCNFWRRIDMFLTHPIGYKLWSINMWQFIVALASLHVSSSFTYVCARSYTTL